jgi:hypothetical protein
MRFSLRSLGAGGNAAPPTSRPLGLVLKQSGPSALRIIDIFRLVVHCNTEGDL